MQVAAAGVDGHVHLPKTRASSGLDEIQSNFYSLNLRLPSLTERQTERE